MAATPSAISSTVANGTAMMGYDGLFDRRRPARANCRRALSRRAREIRATGRCLAKHKVATEPRAAKDWRGQHYASKQIVAFAAAETNGWLVITVIVRDF